MSAADWQSWITWRLIALLAGYIAAAAFCGGCTIDVNHKLPADRNINVNVTVDVDDCAYCLPRVCGRCEHSDGTRCEGCSPACLGGRYMSCGPMGPQCSNDGPGGRVSVPVVCIASGDGGA